MHVGESNPRILIVDDDDGVRNFLFQLLNYKYDCKTISSAETALNLIRNENFALVLSDINMSGMSGLEMVPQLLARSPDTVVIMISGLQTIESAIAAMRVGAFDYITKPFNLDQVEAVVDRSMDVYELRVAKKAYEHQLEELIAKEKDLLKRTLSGSIKMLTEVLSMVNPTAFGAASRVRDLVSKMALQLEFEDAWQVEVAAMLSHVGCVTVPESILVKKYMKVPLSAEEQRILDGHPQVGHDLVSRIPRLEQVAQIIAYQEKQYDGSGEPRNSDKSGESIPFGARILKLALDFERLVESGASRSKALEEINKRSHWYDPAIALTLNKVITAEEENEPEEFRFVKADELTLNMVLAEDVISVKGLLLLTKGQRMTESLILRLENFVWAGAVKEPLKVRLPTKKKVG